MYSTWSNLTEILLYRRRQSLGVQQAGYPPDIAGLSELVLSRQESLGLTRNGNRNFAFSSGEKSCDCAKERGAGSVAGHLWDHRRRLPWNRLCAVSERTSRV